MIKKVSSKRKVVTASGRKKPGATGSRTTRGSEPRSKARSDERAEKFFRAISVRVSDPAGVSVSGEMAASRAEGGGGGPRRSFSKGPTSEQYTAMAGAMYNALERLRGCSAMWRKRAEDNQGWLQPGHLEQVLKELDAAANTLRVGLKARFQRETPRAS